MKTLIIHPDDRSTDFLRDIYAGIENYTLVTESWFPEDIIRMLIENHDRVIMMGHGSPGGLFRIGWPWGYMINERLVDILRKQTENVYIWCHADQFVEHYNLKGFYTGMVISEVLEALMCNIKNPTQQEVNISNNLFARTIGEVINKSPQLMYESVKQHYTLEDDPIIKYNNDRIYYAI